MSSGQKNRMLGGQKIEHQMDEKWNIRQTKNRKLNGRKYNVRRTKNKTSDGRKIE